MSFTFSRLIAHSSVLATAKPQALRCLSTSHTSNLIINAVGEDRLGIVSEITKHVTGVGGNVGESRAAKLGSHFSLMMLIQVPSEKITALKADLATMKDMNVSTFETSTPKSEVTPRIGYSGAFSLEGADHPGIVHKVTSILAKHGLSIDTMETSDDIAPHGGTTLFRMHGIANAAEPLASGFDVKKIKDELQELGDSLNCDVSLEDVEDESYQGSFYGG